ncbi:MAG: class I SAM-dependent methyltransferase [Xanthomonadales bacterium]|nr:rhodoquinone biosynthesis methyltransferase RquA [Gammaproteobacteria bacterium]NND57158.1 class I SAM-dependent methyltransferase [Xanthomonadales bacterium]NNK52808.1 class I SAM-dependent methyltransferase [Xanthomonadales bacterium]
MNDDSRAVAENFDYPAGRYSAAETGAKPVNPVPDIPEYLQDTYWWAYLHPKSFYFFEREWVVNLILWGNMKRLTDTVLEELSLAPQSQVLQVACVYGDFSNRVARHLDETGSRLHIVDVAPIQIENVRKKVSGRNNVEAHLQDSTSMHFPAESFDQTVVFFLLHEQPEYARRKTVEEAIRVTKPGGKVIFVDYHGPKRKNPMRYVMKPILATLEPYAMDLWREELPAFMPESVKPEQIQSDFYFGGLYQKIVLTV